MEGRVPRVLIVFIVAWANARLFLLCNRFVVGLILKHTCTHKGSLISKKF